MKAFNRFLRMAFFTALFFTFAHPLLAGKEKQVSTSKKQPSEAAKKRVRQSYGNLPLYFIENRGQVDRQVRFYTKLSNQTIYFIRDRIVFDLTRRPKAQDVPVKYPSDLTGQAGSKAEKQRTTDKRQQAAERLVFSLLIKGAEEGASVKGVDKQKHRVNYFVGKRITGRRTSLPTGESSTRTSTRGSISMFTGTKGSSNMILLSIQGQIPGRYVWLTLA